MTERDSYNDGYTHEMLHTAHVLRDTWEQHVIETRCADEFPDVKAAAERAAQAMFDLYQLAGQKFMNDDATRAAGERAPTGEKDG